MAFLFLDKNISSTSRWQPAPHAGWVRETDRIAVVDRQEGKVFYFNGTGAEMWEALCKKITVAEITALLADRYQAPLKKIEADVRSFIADLRSRDLIEHASV